MNKERLEQIFETGRISLNNIFNMADDAEDDGTNPALIDFLWSYVDTIAERLKGLALQLKLVR